MPNWCDNSGQIKGDKATLDEIWNIIHQGTNESDGHDARPALTALRPCPDDLVNTTAGFLSESSDGYAEWKAKQEANKAKYGYTDWYGWCVDNWGTKWTPDFEFERHDGYISFSGQTAWSPPEELMRYISEKYPVLIEMSYSEEGMFFIGCSIFEKGETYCSSAEPTAQWNDDFSNDDEYYEALDNDRNFHERIAYEYYTHGRAVSRENEILLGRDILPRMGEASVTTTLTGEVVVSMDAPTDSEDTK